MAAGLSRVDLGEVSILRVDYSVAPSLIPLAEPGKKINLTRYGIAEHPNRTDIVEIDVSRIERCCVVASSELEISGDEYCRRLEESDRGWLDVRVMEEFLKNQSKIPAAYRCGITCFPETKFVDDHGDHFIAGFAWNGEWFVHRLYCLKLRFFSPKKLAAYLAASS
jgi:hypothetical protein